MGLYTNHKSNVMVTIFYMFPCRDNIFISWCCHNKSLQSRWLTTTEMYSLTVLGARSPKFGCEKDWLLWKLSGISCLMLFFFFLLVACDHWHNWLVDNSLQSLMMSSHHLILYVCVSTFFLSYKDTLTGLRVHPYPLWSYLEPCLNKIIKTLIPNKVTLMGIGILCNLL